MSQPAIILDWNEEAKAAEIEGEELTQFIELFVSDMLPRLQHLQRGIQSNALPLGTLLAVQREIFEGLALFFSGIPPDYKWIIVERIAPGWAELVALMERNRLLAKKLAERRA